MAEMEDKLGAILSNPQMMQQIMAMAQMMGQANSQPSAPSKKEDLPRQPQLSLPTGNDAAMLQRIYGLARQSGIDKNQQALLKALAPYLSRDRIVKLEKAMRAAKIAGLASTALGINGAPFFSGR